MSATPTTSIMMAARQEMQHTLFHSIYQPMLIINASAPATREIKAQALGLADSVERGTLSVSDQRIYALNPLEIDLRPITIVFPGIGME
jgi:hypothetical protein